MWFADYYKYTAKRQYNLRMKNMHASNRLFYDAKATQIAPIPETHQPNMLFWLKNIEWISHFFARTFLCKIYVWKNVKTIRCFSLKTVWFSVATSKPQKNTRAGTEKCTAKQCFRSPVAIHSVQNHLFCTVKSKKSMVFGNWCKNLKPSSSMQALIINFK